MKDWLTALYIDRAEMTVLTSFSGPACAPAAVAEQPTSPLTIYGHIDATRDGVAALVAVGVDQLTLRSEHGLIKADVAGGVAVATSNDPPLSVTVAAIDGRSVRRPLAADSGTAAGFYLSVLEGARRDALATAVAALNDALTNVPASGGLSLDNFQDRFIRVGVDTTASADQQAQLRAIVARFPNLAADVELVEMTTSANDLLQLMDEVQRAWGNDPSFVSIGIGVGVIDVEHRTGSELPAAVQAIIDKSPQLFHVTESDGAFSY